MASLKQVYLSGKNIITKIKFVKRTRKKIIKKEKKKRKEKTRIKRSYTAINRLSLNWLVFFRLPDANSSTKERSKNWQWSIRWIREDRGGWRVRDEIRDNYKLVSCSVLSLVEFWIRPAWLAFRVSLRHGISAFLGKKRVADPQSRVKTHVPVLGDTCSDGTTHVAP